MELHDCVQLRQDCHVVEGWHLNTILPAGTSGTVTRVCDDGSCVVEFLQDGLHLADVWLRPDELKRL